ncbi:hypothetical protein O6H91_02G061500 [Diphasiastrum complanatum]|uniref:Uncharacterized protein n=1 Tax=Diphasiastrum complanatum TaxID=34168 RepID=A0ACC2EG29_DIPCM|nr:hypothetical protein O6H91_02G061500 [Diphasiastrum complanatum]
MRLLEEEISDKHVTPQKHHQFARFLYDREWMVVSADKGRVFAQARFPKFALVQPSLPAAAFKGEELDNDAVLEVKAPGMAPLKVPLKRARVGLKGSSGGRGSGVDVTVWTWSGHGIDEGPEAAAWWSSYLGLPARFVRFDADSADRQVEYAPAGYVTGFSNTGQFMFASEASLTDLNKRLPSPLSMNRFRPSITLRGPRAFEEDKWKTFSTMHSGKTLVFTFVEQCARCKVPTINQENPTGVGEEPLKTLATFRSGEVLGLKRSNGKKVYFGAYYVCDLTRDLKRTTKFLPRLGVGDKLTIISK